MVQANTHKQHHVPYEHKNNNYLEPKILSNIIII